MKKIKIYSVAIAAGLLAGIASCGDKLTEANINPNGVDQAVGNPNMIMPTVVATAATDYLNRGWGTIGGVVQHIQHVSWGDGVNHYDWGPDDWTSYYGILRNNNFLLTSPNASPFHRGVALTMRAFTFGMITDLWGDAPYTNAMKGDQGIFEPEFDSQETIYRGIFDDLQAAADIFAAGDNTGYLNGYDVFYNGDPAAWHRLANTLVLRYAMRVSDKLPDVAKTHIERVAASGVYIKEPSQDAVINYVGTQQSNAWPHNYDQNDLQLSDFRRRVPAKAFVDQLLSTGDPRLSVWWAPVRVQWVQDNSLGQYMDDVIYRDGERLDVVLLSEADFRNQINAGHKFTRRFNIAHKQAGDLDIDPNLYVGLPAGLSNTYTYNGNPVAGQDFPNQHISTMSDLYWSSGHPDSHDLKKARIISASEASFILAEAALKGWSVNGSAETHYLDGIRKSLATWKKEGDYGTFVNHPEVRFDSGNALEQIITQKWIASYTGATEAWMDFRRTGLPRLQAGPQSTQPVLPVRLIYGTAEQLGNPTNIQIAIGNLEQNQYTNQPNSQWSKPWIIQGTGKPW